MAISNRCVLVLLLACSSLSAGLLAQNTYPLGQQSPTGWSNVTFLGIRGYRFTCNAANVNVNELGCWYPDSSSVAKTVTLYDFNSQQVLAQVTTTPGSGWCWTALTTPVVLTSGQDYIVAGYSPTGHYYNNAIPASWTPTGTISYVEMRYQNSPSSANQFPTGVISNSHHGVVDIGYTVGAATSAPTITSTAPTFAPTGSAYTYTPTATGTPTPTFSISPDPATLGSGWLTWNGTTLGGTPAAGDVGTYGPFTLTATNGVSPDDTEVFSVNVALPVPEIDIDDPLAGAVTSGDTYRIYAAQAGVSSTGNFVVTNNGNVNLTFTNTPVVTASAVVNCTLNTTSPSGPLGAGNSSTMVVDVTPTAAGTFSFTLSIDSNDADEGTFVINFTGVAKATPEPEIAVLDAVSADVASGSTISETNTGTLMFNRAFTVRNEGGAALNLTGTTPVAVSGQNNCTVIITQPSSTIAAASTWAAATDSFAFDITPGTAGAFGFTVTIVNNDSDEGTFTFTYSGNTTTGSVGSLSGGGGGGGGGGCTGAGGTTPWLLLATLLAMIAAARRSEA
ncbi:MAG: DUF4082 domain-containing protein [Planctomycetes bacterium]|nr:DUF4082 domain-containing protein [Planctomycetota bacterium]